MRNDEFSSTAFSHRPDDVQEVRTKKSKNGRHDVENEALDEGAERFAHKAEKGGEEEGRSESIG